MSCPKKPKYTLRKRFEEVRKTSLGIVQLPNYARTKAIKDGKSKNVGGGYGRSKNFIKAKNTRIYKVRKWVYYPFQNDDIWAEMDYQNKQLTQEELDSLETQEETYGISQSYLIADGNTKEFYGEIKFPNLTIEALEDIRIQPVFIHPTNQALDPTAPQGATASGFRSQDQNQDFPELYEYIHFWKKTNEDENKGLIYQFRAITFVNSDDEYQMDFELWFQALNNKVWQEVQHKGV